MTNDFEITVFPIQFVFFGQDFAKGQPPADKARLISSDIRMHFGCAILLNVKSSFFMQKFVGQDGILSYSDMHHWRAILLQVKSSFFLTRNIHFFYR